MRRLGYRAVQTRARIAPAGAPPRVLVNSIPKAGTHLVTGALDHFPDLLFSGVYINPRALKLTSEGDSAERVVSPEIDWDRMYEILKRPKTGQYAISHLGPQPEFIEILGDLGYRIIFVYRDPRDVVVSTAMYGARLPRHPQYRRFTEAHTSDQDRMLAMITGFPPDELGQGMGSLGARLRGFLPWMRAPGTLPCRFEELVGERGGGSARAQLRALRSIGAHIHRPLTEQMAADIARQTWSAKSATFRTGMIGEWRTRFDGRLREAFAREVGDDVLNAYGYEADS